MNGWAGNIDIKINEQEELRGTRLYFVLGILFPSPLSFLSRSRFLRYFPTEESRRI